jgi:hypothetical protein
MVLSGFLPAVSRRAIVVVGVAALVGVGSYSTIKAQQTPPAAAPQQPKMPFAPEAKSGLIYFTVKDADAADFESTFPKIKEALGKSDKAERKQQAAGWKVYKLPPANGSIVYICIVDPVVTGADYDPMKILTEAFPTEAQALFAKFKGVQSINMTAIDKVADLSGGGL